MRLLITLILSCLLVYLASEGAHAQPSASALPPALPDCSKMKNTAERSRAIDEYVEHLEAQIEKDPKLVDKDEYRPLVALVSAHLLSEATPFRSLDLECWAHFEQARRELKNGKPLKATQAGERWQRCLIAKEDELLATAAPLLKCLNVPLEK